eukprot:GSA120T00006012001.1
MVLYVVRSPNGSNQGVFLTYTLKNDRQFSSGRKRFLNFQLSSGPG